MTTALSATAENPFGTKTLSLYELEQFLAANRGMKDHELAQRLYDLKLNERLSEADLAQFEKGLPGRKSSQGLLVLADESAFLDPPAAEIPSFPAPGHDDQIEMLKKAVDYVNTIVLHAPNLAATQTTLKYLGTSEVVPSDLLRVPLLYGTRPDVSSDTLSILFPDVRGVARRLNLVDEDVIPVSYRAGIETSKRRGGFPCFTAWSIPGPPPGDLGPVLVSLPEVLTNAKVTWGRWEQGPGGIQAVFHYELPPTSSALTPQFCSIERPIPSTVFDAHGEFAIDPHDGSILQLSAVLQSKDERGEWGPVELETKTEFGPVSVRGSVHLCPVKRIAIFLGPMVAHAPPNYPLIEYVNDITLNQYHETK
jgi:hypothetical protein